MKKYFKSKTDAQKEAKERNEKSPISMVGVYKMPKGSRHPGMYAVCSYIEFINTY